MRALKGLLIGCLSLTALISATARAASLPTSNLTLWLKADAGVLNPSNNPAANNDRVNAWLDQSSQGHDGAPTTVNFQPTYKTNDVNGLPAVDFATIGPGG